MAQHPPQRQQRTQQASSPWNDLDQAGEDAGSRRREPRRASALSQAGRGLRAAVWVCQCGWALLVAVWLVLSIGRCSSAIQECSVAALGCAGLVAGYIMARGLTETAREIEGK